MRHPTVQAEDVGSAACLLVVVARHVLLHTLSHRLVLAGSAADHSTAHPTLRQHGQDLRVYLLVVRVCS